MPGGRVGNSRKPERIVIAESDHVAIAICDGQKPTAYAIEHSRLAILKNQRPVLVRLVGRSEIEHCCLVTRSSSSIQITAAHRSCISKGPYRPVCSLVLDEVVATHRYGLFKVRGPIRSEQTNDGTTVKHNAIPSPGQH